MFVYGILTSSDSSATGHRQDTSGELIQKLMPASSFELKLYEIVADDQAILEDRLRTWTDENHLDIIVTTGSTGLTARDVMPEATRAVIDWEVPGIAEAMRMQTFHSTPLSMISRSVVGVRRRTLIINLPGSPKGVRECLGVVLPVLPHAIEMLRGQPSVHEAT